MRKAVIAVVSAIVGFGAVIGGIAVYQKYKDV